MRRMMGVGRRAGLCAMALIPRPARWSYFCIIGYPVETAIGHDLAWT